MNPMDKTRFPSLLGIIALTATFLLTSCGQKGPLYLPEPPKNNNYAHTIH